MKLAERRDRLASFEQECRRRGLALTIQRRTVFEELLERTDHPTADQVFDAVHRRLPSLSRTTVYRVLETLVETGFARKVHHPDAVVRFDPATGRHHHLVCENCGRLVDLDDSVVPRVPIPDAEGTGFRIRDYSVSFNGLCSSCHRQRALAEKETRPQWPRN
jgi:Fur family peroxide stress response transcriptional regulator